MALLTGANLGLQLGVSESNGDLTAIAALTTQAFGRSLLTQADAAGSRALIGAQAALGYTPVNKAGDTDRSACLEPRHTEKLKHTRNALPQSLPWNDGLSTVDNTHHLIKRTPTCPRSAALISLP